MKATSEKTNSNLKCFGGKIVYHFDGRDGMGEKAGKILSMQKNSQEGFFT